MREPETSIRLSPKVTEHRLDFHHGLVAVDEPDTIEAHHGAQVGFGQELSLRWNLSPREALEAALKILACLVFAKDARTLYAEARECIAAHEAKLDNWAKAEENRAAKSLAEGVKKSKKAAATKSE